MKIFGCPKCRFFVGVGHQIHFEGGCAPWFALGGSRKISRVANRAILGMLLGVGGAKPPQFVIVWPCGGLGAWANMFGAPWGVVGPLGALWCIVGEQHGKFPHSQGGVGVVVLGSPHRLFYLGGARRRVADDDVHHINHKRHSKGKVKAQKGMGT